MSDKTTNKDLSQDVLDSLKKTDKIDKEIFSTNGILLSENGEIRHTKLNKKAISKVFDTSLINTIKNSSAISIQNSSILLSNNPTHKCYKALMKPNLKTYYSDVNGIQYFKFIRNILIVINSLGELTIKNVVKNMLVYKGNVLQIIQSQLLINLSPNQIVNIYPNGSGIYISTIFDGVIYFDIIKKVAEKKYPENNVLYMEMRNDGMLLIGDCISIYTKDNLRKYINHIFTDKNIRPIKVLCNGKKIFILCSSYVLLGLKDLIYVFEQTETSLNKVYIYENQLDSRSYYYYDFYLTENELIFVSNKDNVIYDINDLAKLPIILYYDNQKNNLIINNTCVGTFIKGNNLHIDVNGANLCYELKDIPFYSTEIYEDKIYLLSNQDIYTISLIPEITNDKNLVFKFPTNLKDNKHLILIEGNLGDSKISVLDGNTLQELQLEFNIDYEENKILSVLGISSDTLIIKMDLPQQDCYYIDNITYYSTKEYFL
jgi:hypothetical protein